MCEETSAKQKVEISESVMSKNDRFAAENRKILRGRGLYTLNLISSPGAGKTTVLESMARYFGGRMAVIEGDIQTRRDAERIERAGCQAWQIETGGACHLDAHAVNHALGHMDLDSDELSLLAIENVGNLICPSGYDLGEDMRIGLLSVPEGDDKVLKYPSLFSTVDVLIINKMDLIPHLDFDVDRAIEECRSLNPDVNVFTVSARTGEGMEEFCGFVESGFLRNTG
ncbi:MAG: hydrogenase nickel incorporation protein HypB [Candidatus Fermentibacteraceae bacterium]|nr:hydrogenase nickel incorporation protein HypB [Candidatus Fermentibacteraceae bacterium]MBN2608512.1 hydrogenase nickel incorporation protein HypB [Candidatus Fermentibacteraceae bacterium]